MYSCWKPSESPGTPTFHPRIPRAREHKRLQPTIVKAFFISASLAECIIRRNDVAGEGKKRMRFFLLSSQNPNMGIKCLVWTRRQGRTGVRTNGQQQKLLMRTFLEGKSTSVGRKKKLSCGVEKKNQEVN